MNIKEIEILLEKYFEASTTVEEERILRRFFQGKNLPNHLKSLQSLFSAIENEAGIKSPVDHEILLMEKISPVKKNPFYSNRRLYWISSIAATILLVLSIIFLNEREYKSLSKNYSPDEVQLALLQITEALNFISLKLNKGTDELSQLGKIDYTRQALESIARLDQGMGQIQSGFSRVDGGLGQLNKLSKLNLITNQ